MFKVLLLLVVFGGCLAWCLRELVRGLLHGKVIGLEGGKGRSFFVEVDKTERPVAFWGFMLQQLIFMALISCVLWMGLFQRYLLAECRPTIVYVQPEDRGTLLIYWERPNRLDDPLEYLVYRGSESGTLNEIARLEAGAADGQYFDRDLRAGTEYKYCIEAKFGGLTQWLLFGKSTRSAPVSGTTRTE